MRKTKRWYYVGHPYGGLEANKDKVAEIIAKLTARHPERLYVSPIHALGFMCEHMEYEAGMELCLELLRGCDVLVLCPGWKESRGCRIERQFAKLHRIPIEFR